MSDSFAEIVHIVPLGHEFDRAVRPFDTATANRVYLVVDTGDGTSCGQSKRDQCMDGIQKQNYTPRVKEYLEEKNIKVEVVETLTFDLEKLLKTLTSLIRLEKERGNEVYINMSSSGRLAAVGAFLAGVAYDVPTYYVHSDYFAKDKARDEHGLSVCKSNKSSFLPDFKLEMPNEAESVILEALYNKSNNDESESRLSSMNLISYLEEKRITGFIIKRNEGGTEPDMRKENSRRLMKLSIIMDKLVTKDKYVTMEKEGRNVMYTITKLGEHAFCLCGMDKDKYAKMFPRDGC